MKQVQHARSVAQVLDVEQYIGRFLAQATSALDARGAAVYLRKDSVTQPLYAFGEQGHVAEVTVLLRHDGTDIGFVVFGPRRSGQSYSQPERQVLEEAGDVLAQLFVLRSGSTSGR